MTTITIHKGFNFDKTDFQDLDEFVDYLNEQEGYGILFPLTENEITPKQKKRFDKALNTSKSKMLNI
ncbi:MAG: hypothetical protein K8R54_04285 [Bacteroidales bacterium]|nr:hypothetical protein [Bacteroidales bacterium]